MRRDGSLSGLWIVRTNGTATGALLARVQDELYVLAFTNAARASTAPHALGAEGQPFYVCSANLELVARELKEAGARGFIVAYDVRRTSFTSAHALEAQGG